MKKALIICSSGITSMIISKRINQYYKNKNINIVTHFTLGEIFLKKSYQDYDLYILSPQVKHLYEQILEKIKENKNVLQISGKEYSLEDDKLEELAKKILLNLGGR